MNLNLTPMPHWLAPLLRSASWSANGPARYSFSIAFQNCVSGPLATLPAMEEDLFIRKTYEFTLSSCTRGSIFVLSFRFPILTDFGAFSQRALTLRVLLQVLRVPSASSPAVLDFECTCSNRIAVCTLALSSRWWCRAKTIMDALSVMSLPYTETVVRNTGSSGYVLAPFLFIDKRPGAATTCHGMPEVFRSTAEENLGEPKCNLATAVCCLDTLFLFSCAAFFYCYCLFPPLMISANESVQLSIFIQSL